MYKHHYIHVICLTVLTIAAAGSVCSGQGRRGRERKATPGDTLQSVRMLPDGSALFSIYAPKAENVSFSGDLRSREPVVKTDNGVWSIRIPDVKPGAYRYSFAVDGIKVYDPKAPLAGETSAIAELDPDGDAFWAMKDVPHGAVSQRFYHSKTLGETRRLHVWTPPGFEKSKKKLPVLYLIHGGGDTDNSWPGVGCAGNILDNLLAEGKIVPMIVVMPNGTIHVSDEVPVFADDMMTSIMPFIEQNYNVYTDRKHRAIAGLSMGGMETMEVAFSHPDLFSHVWVLSSSFKPGKSPEEESARLEIKKNAAKMNSCFKDMVFTQGGPTDIAYKNNINTRSQLDKDGLKYEYLENAQAGHSWSTWRMDLFTLAQRLFK